MWLKLNLKKSAPIINKVESKIERLEIRKKCLKKVEKIDPMGVVTIPNYIEEIQKDAFVEVRNKLKKVIIEGSIRELPEYLFYKCRSLEEVIFNTTNLIKINKHCFNGAGIKRISIPETVVEISEFAFQNCDNLEELVIKSKRIKSIKSHTFICCSNLKRVELCENIYLLNRYSFAYCDSLVSFIAPGVELIEEDVFYNTNNLNEIVFKEGCKYVKGNFKKLKGLKKHIKTHYIKVKSL